MFTEILQLVLTYLSFPCTSYIGTSAAAIFVFKWSLSLCTYIPRMNVMLDFICIGPFDLPGVRQKRYNTKSKIIGHSWTRTHNPDIRSMML